MFINVFCLDVDYTPRHSVSGTSPDGPIKILTSGTYRGPSEDS